MCVCVCVFRDYEILLRVSWLFTPFSPLSLSLSLFLSIYLSICTLCVHTCICIHSPTFNRHMSRFTNSTVFLILIFHVFLYFLYIFALLIFCTYPITFSHFAPLVATIFVVFVSFFVCLLLFVFFSFLPVLFLQNEFSLLQSPPSLPPFVFESFPQSI